MVTPYERVNPSRSRPDRSRTQADRPGSTTRQSEQKYGRRNHCAGHIVFPSTALKAPDAYPGPPWLPVGATVALPGGVASLGAGAAGLPGTAGVPADAGGGLPGTCAGAGAPAAGAPGTAAGAGAPASGLPAGAGVPAGTSGLPAGGGVPGATAGAAAGAAPAAGVPWLPAGIGVPWLPAGVPAGLPAEVAGLLPGVAVDCPPVPDVAAWPPALPAGGVGWTQVARSWPPASRYTTALGLSPVTSK